MECFMAYLVINEIANGLDLEVINIDLIRVIFHEILNGILNGISNGDS
jgi:hypothetical protein